MKLNRSTVVLPLAGLLVVAGAGAVMATSSPSSTATDTTVIPAVASPSPGATDTTRPKDTVLTDVLDKLVADGTINASQKQAILDGVTAERTARQAAREAERQQMQTFLADGVITQEEFDQLPADSPLRQMTTLMDDGKITTEELQGLGRGFGFGGRGHGGHHGGGMFGPDGDGNGTTPDASASPGTSS